MIDMMNKDKQMRCLEDAYEGLEDLFWQHLKRPVNQWTSNDLAHMHYITELCEYIGEKMEEHGNGYAKDAGHMDVPAHAVPIGSGRPAGAM